MLVPPLLGSSIEGSDFVLAEWRDDGEKSANADAPLPSSISADDEAWYVLEGALGFVRGDERLEASAGAGVLVPGRRRPTFWNASSEKARYLLVMTPRVAALVAALHDPAREPICRDCSVASIPSCSATS